MTQLNTLLTLFSELLKTPVTVDSEILKVFGAFKDNARITPRPSSAVLLRVGDHSIYVPAPYPRESEHLVPVFLLNGKECVLPIVRLMIEINGSVEREYISYEAWISDAFRRWRFQYWHGTDTGVISLMDLFHKKHDKYANLPQKLHFIQFAMLYAIKGYRDQKSVGFRKNLNVIFPKMPPWFRPFGGSLLSKASSRALVLTAKWKLAPINEPKKAKENDVPQEPSFTQYPAILSDKSGKKLRINPSDDGDRGLDPVHTPEQEAVRIQGHLGKGVQIDDRKLNKCANGLAMSVSTRQLPFAGYNDPRRLLLAAKMQAQAIDLYQAEEPIVRSSSAESDDPPPPGANLLVGYLAWEGWNHEDAWVISQSAAKRFEGHQESVQWIGIRSLEMRPKWRRDGVSVEAGQILVHRYVSCQYHDLHFDKWSRPNSKKLRGLVRIRPTPEDKAKKKGTIRVRHFDLTKPHLLPSGWKVDKNILAHFRMIIEIRIQQRYDLQVGDKLANRHGHKGIVGKILPDNQMPLLNGNRLEALIDPISVVNRSNWGQVYESLAGATANETDKSVIESPGNDVLSAAKKYGADDYGRWNISPPNDGDSWLKAPTQTVAGTQFVMRLPQHASEKYLTSPSLIVANRKSSKRQRFGERAYWALMAHGLVDLPRNSVHESVAQWGRFLQVAGFEFDQQLLCIKRITLSGEPPVEAKRLDLSDETSVDDMWCQIDKVSDDNDFTVLVFPKAVEIERPPHGGSKDQNKVAIKWIRVLPINDRPPYERDDGHEHKHDLTSRYKNIITYAKKKASTKSLDDLKRALFSLMSIAYTTAVGLNANGLGSSKESIVGKKITSREVPRSGSAVISPAGSRNEGPNTIWIPLKMMRDIFGTLSEGMAWISRDPVLDRGGLLRVTCKPGKTLTIQVPPSILGPLAGDFDGDTAKVFAELPNAKKEDSAAQPSNLAIDGLKKPLIWSGKQYVFGLHNILKNSAARNRLNVELGLLGSPAIKAPESDQTAKDMLEAWVLEVATITSPQTQWWATLERHMLNGLAQNAGMGFGVMSADELLKSPLLKSGAAKREIYEDGHAISELMSSILAGCSLKMFEEKSSPENDPIAVFMVPNKGLVRSFGGVVRRLLFRLKERDPALVRHVHALTAPLYQLALTSKNGTKKLPQADCELIFESICGSSEDWDVGETIKAMWEDRNVKFAVAEIMKMIEPEFPWLKFLRHPHTLAEMLQTESSEPIRLRPDDFLSYPFQT